MTRVEYMMGATRHVTVIPRSNLRAWCAEHAHCTILSCRPA